jgi:signal peptidase I
MSEPRNTNIADLDPRYANPAFLSLMRQSFPAPADTAPRGRALLAFGAAMIWPGLGHLISGRAKWAATWCLLWSGILGGVVAIFFFPQFLPAAIVLLPLGAIVQLLQLIHAARCGRSARGLELIDPSMRMMIGPALALAGLGIDCGLINYAQNNWIEICYSPTPSMSPAVSPGDLFVNFRHAAFGRWDIVGADLPAEVAPDRRLCKRVVGMPGDRIEITGAGLLINGKLTSPPPGAGPYISVDSWNNVLLDSEPMAAANGCWGKPIALGSDEYFLLGDNSAVSGDSRFWSSIDEHQPGAVPKNRIIGRVVGIIWPPPRWRAFDSTALNAETRYSFGCTRCENSASTTEMIITKSYGCAR